MRISPIVPTPFLLNAVDTSVENSWQRYLKNEPSSCELCSTFLILSPTIAGKSAAGSIL